MTKTRQELRKIADGQGGIGNVDLWNHDRVFAAALLIILGDDLTVKKAALMDQLAEHFDLDHGDMCDGLCEVIDAYRLLQQEPVVEAQDEKP